MTVEQKVGQLLFLGFGGTRVDDRSRRLLAEKRPGGLALFARNIVDREQVRALTRSLGQAMAQGGEVPPFLAVDQEGGNVMRLKERTSLLPSAMALGATRSPALAEAAGRAVGQDLRAHGLNMNFAPVLDVNNNPGNPVIGVRSFGEKPELVTELGSAFIAGLRAMGVAAVAKHFPGHGDTVTDSHFQLPVVEADRARLDALELTPFRRAAAEGLSAVMTAHLALPRVTEEPGLPASLSRRVLVDILRREMRFPGLILTDGLEMEAVAKGWGAGQAAVRAIQNGADMVMVLWFAERRAEVHRALLAAARSGVIPVTRLDDAVLRVLGEKARLGLLGPIPPLPEVSAQGLVGTDDQVAAASVTLLRNRGGVLPVRRGQSVLVVTPQPLLARAIKQRVPDTSTILLSSTSSASRRREATRQALLKGREVDVVVVAVINDVQAAMVRDLIRDRPGRPVVAVSLASPYVVKQFPNVDAYLCTYSYLRPALVAAARVISGHAPSRGRLPVTIPGQFAYGDGIVPPRLVEAGR
jgi:beta-N-acetylhexosaminidase